MKISDYEKTSAAPFLWLSQQCQKGSPIIQEKALFFRRQLEIYSEKLSTDSEVVGKLCEKFQKINEEENLTLDQI